MNKSEVYITIPLYNDGKMITKVIRDLNSYGYENIVVVDDGSKDNGYSVVKKDTNAIVTKLKLVLESVVIKRIAAIFGVSFNPRAKLTNPALKKCKSLMMFCAVIPNSFPEYLSDTLQLLMIGLFITAIDISASWRYRNSCVFSLIQIQ